MGRLKTPQEVRAEFNRVGQPVSKWADEHGFNRSLVYAVLAGRKKCKRGIAHKIAVMLSLKDGVIAED
ncbi:DNA-binding protein [Salmonella enterica subsp. enterica serovar Oranienburg]|nr:DNA-binding protein [Salmonella enterica subsp. enterica serovar Oranienburg]ECD5542855.1 DNA-binding protein [Salmonella enterica subsp. enterica serovar Kokomlemle]HAF2283657.1 DNA-binding protein [Salmonella enterica]EBX4923443.1 DNA-binding protein [Salmonella enterica subsp. enterica serovar Oranienburg]EDT5580045.1 DNA-binding protein [Salmonella enterica subsp. enterica serovar Kokomlemle]